MAGFLAPVINEVGAARTGVSAPVDTSVAQAISGIGDIINVGLRSTPEAKEATQADRDAAALKPFISEAIRIEGLRSSGSVSAGQITSLIRANKIAAISALPTKSDTVTSALSSIHGEDIDIKETNFVNARREQITKAFVEDPTFIAKMPRVMKFAIDENGEFDVERAEIKMEEIFQEEQAKVAADKALKEEVERVKLRGDLNKENQKALVDPFIAKARQEATETVSGLVTTFDTTGARPSDVSAAIVELTARRDAFASEINARAANAGFLNDKDVYDVNLILEPFDRLINTLNTIQAQPEILVNLQRAGAELKMGEMLLRLGIQPTQAAQDYAAALIVEGKQVDIELEVDRFLKMPVEPTTAETPSFGVFEEGQSAVNPELVRAGSQLPESKQIEVVQRSLEGFYLAEDYKGTNPVVRTEAVELFGRAVGIMFSTGKDISESTFNKTYRPEFFSIYNDITSVDDDTSITFRALVAEHIGTTLQQAIVKTEFKIQNNLSEQFPGVALVFNGKTYDVTLGKGQGLGTRQDRLESALTLAGLPVTMSGLEKLVSDPAILGRSGVAAKDVIPTLNAAKEILGTVKPQLRYLNKIVAVGSQLEGVEAVLPTSEEGAPETTPPTRVTNREDVLKLKDGEPWVVTDEKGNVLFSGIAGKD